MGHESTRAKSPKRPLSTRDETQSQSPRKFPMARVGDFRQREGWKKAEDDAWKARIAETQQMSPKSIVRKGRVPEVFHNSVQVNSENYRLRCKVA